MEENPGFSVHCIANPPAQFSNDFLGPKGRWVPYQPGRYKPGVFGNPLDMG